MLHGSKNTHGPAGAELLEADGQAGSGAQQVGDGEGWLGGWVYDRIFQNCDGCTTCVWRGPYIQGMRQEAHVILYQQATKIVGNIHGHAKMVLKII